MAWTSLTKSRIIQSNPPTAQISEAIPSLPTEKKQITLMLVGDIMLNRGVELEIKKRDDWNWPFLKIAKKLKDADIAFGNLEGPISDKGAKVGSIYSFRMDPKAIDSLKSAGFDILSLANNHAFDYGRQALKDTYDRLEQAGIDYVGGGLNATEAGTPAIKEVYGTKFAFLAYTDLCLDSWKPTKDSAGINCTYESDLENIKKNIKNAKNSADIVIVSLHSGNEYVENLTPFQINFSKSAIDAGADLVAGHHPHIVQKNEEYFSTSSGKTGYIFYSLGNFVFDQKFSEATMRGLMVKVIVKDKKISEVVPINIKINSDFQPEIETKEKTASSLDITKKILSWGHIATTTPRFIDAIVIHSSFDALGKDPYSVDGVIKEYGIYKVAPHYLISRSGAIYQLAPENNIAYHAGASEMPDTRINVNNFSMGIELIYKNNEEPSQAQYSSLAKLASHLQKKYGIPKNNILGHKDIAPERKTDPWNFDWEKFYKILQRQAPAPQTSSVFLSSEKLKQGDTLLIRIENKENIQGISGQFGSAKIFFFESGEKIWGITGIDAKKPPGTYKLTVNFPDSQKFEKQIEVADANFPITVLAFTKDLEEKGYNATSVQETIAKNDGPKLYETLAISSEIPYFTEPFVYPLDKIVDVGAFGNIRKSGDVSLQHLGVDLDAKTNTPVYTVNDGVVKATLELIDYGKTIVVDHGLGIFSLYLHMEKFNVEVGQKVERGQVIGLSGNSGYSTEPHLHFSVKISGASVDPLKFIETIKKELKE